MRNECNIVRDIIPLYLDNIASEDSVSFVEEHIMNCEKCRIGLEKMQESVSIEESYKKNTDDDDNALPLQVLRKKMKKKKWLTIIFSSFVTLGITLCLLFMLIIQGFPAHSSSINIKTEFQYCEGAYLDQAFVLHLYSADGTPINVTVDYIYATDESGKEILVGYEIVPRNLLDLKQNPSSFAIGYSPSESGITEPTKDFDFIITIKFKDKEVTYSMVDEGVFEKQEIME